MVLQEKNLFKYKVNRYQCLPAGGSKSQGNLYFGHVTRLKGRQHLLPREKSMIWNKIHKIEIIIIKEGGEKEKGKEHLFITKQQ